VMRGFLHSEASQSQRNSRRTTGVRWFTTSTDQI
jgi:hypothetical protein